MPVPSMSVTETLSALLIIVNTASDLYIIIIIIIIISSYYQHLHQYLSCQLQGLHKVCK